MDEFRELLACPACASGSHGGLVVCAAAALASRRRTGFPTCALPGDARTDAVRRFYERAPFPGYPPRDSLQALHARAERSVFARLLDQAIPGDARIVEIGCGTGQMCLYLARADRVVIGADLTRAALLLGAAAARRFGLDRVQFVETDLRQPGLKAGAFDVVYSSGVLHHTPEPARVVRPSGAAGAAGRDDRARRLQRVRARPAAAAASRGAAVGLPRHPVRSGAARSRRTSRRGGEAWLRDQYQHPEEHRHTLAEVQGWFAENRVEYLRTYPSAVLGDEPGELFAPAADNWRAGGLAGAAGLDAHARARRRTLLHGWPAS